MNRDRLPLAVPLALVLLVGLPLACGGAGSASDAGGGQGGAGQGGAAGQGGSAGQGGAGADGGQGGAGADAGQGGAGGDAGQGGAGGGAGGDAAACTPVGEQMHDALPALHVNSIGGYTYDSNPPSSGWHCPVWGQYAEYTSANPLPRCNYLHDLEHGAVVLLYKCPDGCPDVVAALEQIRADAKDPDCTALKRVIITPDPDIDTTVAATAWQYTWTSSCLSGPAVPSLAKFVKDHLGSAGKAPESGICADGSVGP